MRHLLPHPDLKYEDKVKQIIILQFQPLIPSNTPIPDSTGMIHVEQSVLGLEVYAH